MNDTIFVAPQGLGTAADAADTDVAALPAARSCQ